MENLIVKVSEEENIVLSSQAVRRLTEMRNGDACLLYLWLRRGGDAVGEAMLCDKLAWNTERFEAAKKALADAELVQLHEAPEKRETAEMPERPMPEYSDEDVMHRLEGDGDFAGLLREIERRLGPVSAPGTKVLLGLRDHLGLPSDVIYLLVNECIAQKEARFGEGSRPTMREIEKEAYRWARKELFTVQEAEAELKKQQEWKKMYPEYQKALQIRGRIVSPSEAEVIRRWIEMGFPPETVAIAYDKTVFNCHEFKWPYCKRIMERWHEKGLHTPEQVLSENSGGKPAKKEKEPVSRKAGMSRYI